ncbi:MAG: DUF4912 domain-containing protein [Arcobacteraceae bacterium]|jgi:hypothetical protein|nr:DUF4912 domain-containing protein [Arcobacteraceae bacterium]
MKLGLKDMDNKNQIIFESLDSGDIGYSGVLKNSEPLPSTNCSYEIPTRYFVDSLTLMAINPHNSYLYWEVTNETLEKLGIPTDDVKLNISIVDEQNVEISSFESSFSVGDYYVHYEIESKSLTAKLHIKVDDNTSVPLLVSNRLKLFDATLKGYKNSPLYSDFVFEDLNEKDEIVNLNSISLVKKKNLSSHTILNKGN